MLNSIYQAVTDVLQLPSVTINGVDYAPLITSCAAALLLILVVCNVFAFLRALFCR